MAANLTAARRAPLPLAVLSASGLLAFSGLWIVLSHSGWIPRAFLPSPFEVAGKFGQLLHKPFGGSTLPMHLLSSMKRYALGFGLAALIGVPLGLMMSWFRWLDDIVTPIFEALRYVAPIAWVPFAALWFGTGIGGPIMIIFTGAFPACLVNSYRGARFVDKRLLEAAQTLGAGSARILFEVIFPAALPSIVAGLRIAAGLGWQSLVGAELIVVSSGIGYLMVLGQSNINTAIVMCGMIAIGVIGAFIDFLLRWVERRVRASWGQTT